MTCVELRCNNQTMVFWKNLWLVGDKTSVISLRCGLSPYEVGASVYHVFCHEILPVMSASSLVCGPNTVWFVWCIASVL